MSVKRPLPTFACNANGVAFTFQLTVCRHLGELPRRAPAKRRSRKLRRGPRVTFR